MVPEAQPGHLPSHPSLASASHSRHCSFLTFQSQQGKGFKCGPKASSHPSHFPQIWKRL